MKRFRFHIGTLVIFVLILGVGLAALRESNETWDRSVFSITLGMLLISILLTVHRTEKRRAFWLGFALFGSVYLGLSLIPSIESRLITSRGLAYLGSKVPRSSPAGAGFVYFDYDNDGSMDLYVVNNSQRSALYRNKGNAGWVLDVVAAGLAGSSGTTENFVRIGHSLLVLIGAFLGGRFSRYFFAKNRELSLGSVNS
jgi:hypothetical protein